MVIWQIRTQIGCSRSYVNAANCPFFLSMSQSHRSIVTAKTQSGTGTGISDGWGSIESGWIVKGVPCDHGGFMIPQRSTDHADGLVSGVTNTASPVCSRRPRFCWKIMSSPCNLRIASLHKSKEDHHHQIMLEEFHNGNFMKWVGEKPGNLPVNICFRAVNEC